MDSDAQADEYRVRVRAPEHVRPVDGVSHDVVPTERLPPSPVRKALAPRRPAGGGRN
ncbi:hypothetical protein ACWCV9_34760 [Streptomyces sp. NPDC001606]